MIRTLDAVDGDLHTACFKAWTVHPDLTDWAGELAFTAEHARHDDRLEREAACHARHILNKARPPQRGDRFAGRFAYPRIGIEAEAYGYGYYCDHVRLGLARAQAAGEARDALNALDAYWREHGTVEKIRRRMTPDQRLAIPDSGERAWHQWESELRELDDATREHFVTSWDGPHTPAPQVGFVLYRIAGTVPDHEAILRLGLPGLRARLDAARPYDRAVMAGLDACDRLLTRWADQAKAVGEWEIAASCRHLRTRPPETLHQAIQFQWMWVVATGGINHGRMDVWAGPFLDRDLKAGRLDEEEATQLLVASWRLMIAMRNSANNRIIIGGRGRPDPETADTFARLAIEATRRVHDRAPALTLRLTEGQSPDLLDRAMDCLAEGNTFPIFYNDDVNIPAYARAAGITEAEAEHYFPLGCGEYTRPGISIDTPDATVNLALALTASLNGGIDPASGRRIGPDTGRLTECVTFEDVWQAYERQVTFHIERHAEMQKLIFDVAAEDVTFPLLSQGYTTCRERGAGLLRGGLDDLGATLETYGNVTAADSLTAIRDLCFGDDPVSKDVMLDALAQGFASHPDLLRRAHAAPKFGNNDPAADAMVSRVHDHACLTTRAQAERVGIARYLVVVINNGYHAFFGRTTGATPDGRRAGTALSNGNAPMAGQGRDGLTTVLRCMAGLRCDHHAGAVHNITVTRDLLTTQREKFRAMLAGYWSIGGSQIMLTPVNPGMLEDAIAHPENYPDLLVRVGGYSARFVDLHPLLQREIADRVCHA